MFCIVGTLHAVKVSEKELDRTSAGGPQQTGRCLNIRLREHRSSLTGTASSHLALHCRDCACTPLLEKAVVLYKHRDQKAREIVEAHRIKKEGSACVSQASLILLDNEVEFLDRG
ncbi:uncharacterized protein ISCGN_010468 [Ixodes scapularis]